ncbi:MAG: hypothetical protein Unbinned200contig1000_72 [Prokaryotic dsDNA virus sp.]|nr:MAG: hypothetical protein Unbinned200contig1000_72 [Prokaryotic dsDNA virus sp.]
METNEQEADETLCLQVGHKTSVAQVAVADGALAGAGRGDSKDALSASRRRLDGLAG